MMKLDADEKELLESVERGEWKSGGGGKRERTRYARYAKATFRKDRRLNSSQTYPLIAFEFDATRVVRHYSTG
jgi:hypothetical protein